MQFGFLILLIVTFSLCPIYNNVGDFGVFLLLIATTLAGRKFVLDKKLFFLAILFGLFFLLKCIGLNNYQAYSQYHSINVVIGVLLRIIFLAFLLPSIIPIATQYKHFVSNAFLICFHLSLLFSISVLIKYGNDTYRENLVTGNMLLAPQEYVTVSIFMILTLVYELIQDYKKRWIKIILLIINVLYLYLANYTTQMIFAVFGILFILIFGSNLSKNKKILLICFLSILSIPSIPIIILLLSKLNQTLFSDNFVVHARINEIILLLGGNSLAGTDLKMRNSLMSISFDTFKEYPLFGIPFSRYNTVFTGLNVGGHSEWIDDLAKFGCIGALFFLSFLFTMFKNLIQSDQHSNSNYKMSLVLIFILYGFFNPIVSYIQLFMIFLITLMADDTVSISSNDVTL